MRRVPASLLARLTRGQLAALAVALVTLAGIGVLVGVFASGWWRDEGGSYAPDGLIGSSRITPQSSLFADPVTAEVDVALDRRRVDPATVRLAPRFGPFEVLSQSRRVDPGVGAATLVRFRYRIECVSAACIPLMETPTKGGGSETKAIALPRAELSARRRDGTTVTGRVAWPQFVVHSRVTAEEAGLSTPHAAPWFTPPAVSWRLSPNLLGALALSVAVLLVLAAGWLVASVVLGDSTRLRVWKVPSHLSPVERALRLAEHAAASAELAEERKALQRLAVELGRTGHGELAERARWLAWADREPTSDALRALAETVRSNGAR